MSITRHQFDSRIKPMMCKLTKGGKLLDSKNHGWGGDEQPYEYLTLNWPVYNFYPKKYTFKLQIIIPYTDNLVNYDE